jgi:hypothetical protein
VYQERGLKVHFSPLLTDVTQPAEFEALQLYIFHRDMIHRHELKVLLKQVITKLSLKNSAYNDNLLYIQNQQQWHDSMTSEQRVERRQEMREHWKIYHRKNVQRAVKKCTNAWRK